MSENYDFCPCGSGKKVKFCCCKDVAKDLAKVKRSLEGEQRAAGLDKIDQLLKAKGNRTGLLVLKVRLEMEMDQVDTALGTVGTLLEHDPNCAAGYAMRAILRYATDDDNEEIQAAVDDVQTSLECSREAVSLELFNALGVIGQGLAESERIAECLGHFLVQLSFGNENLSQGLENYSSVMSSANVPVSVKAIVHQAQAYSASSEEKVKELWAGVYRGRWRQVKADLVKSELATTSPDALRVLATVESFLGNSDAAVLAWRELGRQLENHHDAIEALAIAQGLDPHHEQIDVNDVEFIVVDADRLKEYMMSHPQVISVPFDPEQMEEEGPPPNAVYRLLDRPQPKSVEEMELKYNSVPKILGSSALYGKQTDRDARLELSTDALSLEACKTLLGDVCGDSLGAQVEDEVVGQVSKEMAMSGGRISLPEDATNQHREQVQADAQQAIFADQFLTFPRSFLDGKSIKDAISDAELKNEAEAALLRVTVLSPLQDEVQNFVKDAGMEPLSAPAIDADHISLFHLHLIDPGQLNEDQMLDALREATRHAAVAAIRRIAPAVIEKLGAELEDIDRVYEELIKSLTSSDEKLEWVQKAAEAAKARDESPAEWLFIEFDLRAQRGEPEQMMAVLNTIQSNHMNEPGVGQRLFQILYSLGLITPDGQPIAPGGMEEPEGIITSDSTGTESGKLWVGDEPVSPSSGGESGGEEKGGLWLPD